MQQQAKPNMKRMRHVSFLLCHEDRDSFRHLCVIWNISPSEALRAMVRISLGGGYREDQIKDVLK